jgi:hypothetical protein
MGSCVVQVTRDELLLDDEYDDILKEVEEELEAKYGELAAIVMPQPSKKGPGNDPAGVGLVFVKFEDLSRAVRCPSALRLCDSCLVALQAWCPGTSPSSVCMCYCLSHRAPRKAPVSVLMPLECVGVHFCWLYRRPCSARLKLCF